MRRCASWTESVVFVCVCARAYLCGIVANGAGIGSQRLDAVVRGGGGWRTSG